MDIGIWLRTLGLEEYDAAFRANAIDVDVLCDLTDQDLEKVGVLLGHRRKLLRAIAMQDGALGPKAAARSMPPPMRPEPTSAVAALQTSAARASLERRQEEAPQIAPGRPQPFAVSSRLRPAEMIDSPFLPSLPAPSSPPASNEGHDGDLHAPEVGEAYDDFQGFPSPRWRDRVVLVIAVLGLAALGGHGRIRLSLRIRRGVANAPN
jgi:SAM domain (Sterile alpha motif)